MCERKSLPMVCFAPFFFFSALHRSWNELRSLFPEPTRVPGMNRNGSWPVLGALGGRGVCRRTVYYEPNRTVRNEMDYSVWPTGRGALGVTGHAGRLLGRLQGRLADCAGSIETSTTHDTSRRPGDRSGFGRSNCPYTCYWALLVWRAGETWEWQAPCTVRTVPGRIVQTLCNCRTGGAVHVKNPELV